MITIPEPISVSFGFDTLLTCEMNIDPDKFQWKFYPTDDPFNPNSVINLSNSSFHLVREEKYTKQRKRSSLTVQVRDHYFYTKSIIFLVDFHLNLICHVSR